MPFVLVGSMAMAMSVAAPAESADAQPANDTHTGVMPLAFSRTARAVLATTSVAPSTYRVVSGDTVSAIAHRFGLSAAKVLALNGLSSRSLIFPGQILKLTAGPILVSSTTPLPSTMPSTSASGIRYTVVSGDTMSRIANRFGVTTSSVLAANQLLASSIIRPGQVIVIPGGVAPASAPASVPPPVTVTVDPPAPPTDESPTPAPDPSLVANTTPTAPAVSVVFIYVIVSGDNVTKIAARFAVSVQSILDANGLTRSSIIYVGGRLTIPGVVAPTPSAGALPSGVSALSAEAQGNARTIIAIAHQLNVSDYGIVIALSTALQESGLRNLSYGDLDSVGLFQQRPSSGWGTTAQLTDPTYATRLFFGGPTNPNHGHTRGLLDIAGWQSMTVTQAAQRVQISAYPNAYAKWEATARYWLAQLS